MEPKREDNSRHSFSPPASEAQSYVLRDYFHMLRRRKWLLLNCFLGTLVPTVLWYKLSPPVYEAVATIIYEEPKDTMIALDLGQAFQNNKSGLINLAELLKSRSLAVEVARTLPKEVIGTFEFPDPAPPNFSPERLLVASLQGNLNVTPVLGSDIVRINVQAHDPLAAQVIANTYVERIIDLNLRKQRAEISSVREFVEKQLLIFQDKLNAAEVALQKFKEDNKMTSLSEASAEMLKRLTLTEATYDQTKTEREAMEQRYRYLQHKKRELAPSLTIAGSPGAQQRKQQLLDLEMQYSAGQVTGGGSNDNGQLALRQKIDHVKEELVQELLQSGQREELIDPLSQIRGLVQETITLEVDLATSKAREQALKKTVDGYEQELAKLPHQEFALARLIRARDVDEKIYSMLRQRHEEVGIAEAGKIGDIHLIDGAIKPLAPIKPNRNKFLASGCFLGLALGIGLALLLESLDNTLKSQDDVEKHLALTVLASIPGIHHHRTLRLQGNPHPDSRYAAKMLSQDNWNSPLYEAFRILQMNFAFLNADRVLRTILMTSAAPGEGKTLTSINLMQTFARAGIKTLLVDCDLRRPMVHQVLGIKSAPGLTDVLINKSEAKRAICRLDSAYAFALPCGTLPPNPSEMLDSLRMRELIAELKSEYQLIILDSPPLIAVADSIILSTEVDGVFLIIRSGTTSRDTALRALRLLEKNRKKVMGAILNAVDFKKTYGDYKSYYYYTNHKKNKKKTSAQEKMAA